MRIGELCTREVVYCRRKTSALEAAQLMRNSHVGDLLVVEGENGERVPAGIITDRDLIVDVMAKEVDPVSITAGELMGAQLEVATESEDFYEVIQRMRQKGIRRMPVVNDQGALVGITTLDDLLTFLSETLADISHISGRQQLVEQKSRP